MRVLLATGLTELEKQLEIELKSTKRCYHRTAVISVAENYKPDVVVLSARLMGEEDIVNDVVKPLRDKGIRVIFLPGNISMNDCREVMKRLIPLGVYCYVYDPVLPAKIIYKIEKPGALGDIPEELVMASLSTEEAQMVGARVVADLAKEEKKEGLLDKFKGLKGVLSRGKPRVLVEPPKPQPIQPQRAGGVFDLPPPEALFRIGTQNAESVPVEQSKALMPLEPTPEHKFIRFDNFVSVQQLINFEGLDIENSSGIIIPSDTPDLLAVIHNLRRSIKLASLPLVVSGRCAEDKCYLSGADECVAVLDQSTIPRILARAKRLKELWEKANRDDLTKVYKRNFIEEYIEEQIRHFNETGVVFSVALIDLDKFKVINDTYGHETGDILLKEFSAFLAKSLRQLDLVARWGGDEFLIVFPRTGPREAAGIMERLRATWSNTPITASNGEKIHGSFSTGVAAYSPGKNVVVEADRVLYEAKAAGRNTIESNVKMELPKKDHITTDALSSTVITFASPWTPNVDTSVLVMQEAKSHAAKGSSVAIIDADFKKAELGARLGISFEEAWKYDWRREPVPLRIEKNVFAFILDPLGTTRDYKEPLGKTIEHVESMGIDRILIDTGDNPEFYFPGYRVLVVDEDELTEAVWKAWESRRPYSSGGILIKGSSKLAERFGLTYLGYFGEEFTTVKKAGTRRELLVKFISRGIKN